MGETAKAATILHCTDLPRPWPDLKIDRSKRGGLVEQIVAAVTDMVSEKKLRVGTKMPSVRQFAKWYCVSTFTVVEAYDRLITQGVLSSRRSSGYFVARTESPKPLQSPIGSHTLPLTEIDTLTPDLYSGMSESLPAGTGWLPPEWYGEATILDAVRQAMRMPSSRLRGYGHARGFPALCQHLASTLSEDLFAVEPNQILLTHGATHAFDLILRTLTKPGDCVLVEDPGYGNLVALIRHHACIPVGIPRGEHGLDFDVLQARAATDKPKLMFVNTVLQNPLGTSLTHAQTHRLLAIAEQFDFWIVEDDIYRELAAGSDPSLAAMDGLRRVIRVGSFSKTLSPALRVGSISASTSLMPEIARVKMLAGLTTSEINERAAYHALTCGSYRRMLERLKTRLDAARERTLSNLGDLGLTPLAKPRGGMFVSAGWQQTPSAECCGKSIADLALQSDILLSPDEFFTIGNSDSIWFRFNVAYSDSPLLSDFLRTVSERLITAGTLQQ